MKLMPAVLVCGSLALATAGGALAHNAASGALQRTIAEEVKGKIASVDLEANTFSMTVTEQPQPVFFSVTDKTLYTLDEASVTKDRALVVGNLAKVTHEDGVASSVHASTPDSPE